MATDTQLRIDIQEALKTIDIILDDGQIVDPILYSYIYMLLLSNDLLSHQEFFKHINDAGSSIPQNGPDRAAWSYRVTCIALRRISIILKNKLQNLPKSAF